MADARRLAQAIKSEPTLSAYQPTLRDKAARALLDALGNGATAQRVVEGLTGSIGLGSTKPGVADFVPVLGQAFQGDEAGRQMASGHPLAGLTNAALAAIPVPAAAKGAKGLLSLGAKVGKPLADIERAAAERGASLSLQSTPRGVTVSKIVVPAEQRGQGIGSDIMGQVSGYADATGRRVMLTPDGSFGGSVPRLRDFYRDLGFVPNKGRTADYSLSESMYREPVRSPGPPHGLTLPDGTSAALDMSHSARMGRAAEQGYTVPAYHETTGAAVPGIAANGFDLAPRRAASGDYTVPFGVFSKPSGDSIGIGRETEAQVPVLLREGNVAAFPSREVLQAHLSRDPAYAQQVGDLRANNKANNAAIDDLWAQQDKLGRSDPRHAAFEAQVDAILEPWKLQEDQMGEQARALGTDYLRGNGVDTVKIASDPGAWGRHTSTTVSLNPGDVRPALDPFNPGGEARIGLPRPGDYLARVLAALPVKR